MSSYTKVERRIWNDQKFRSLTDNGKLVFFFLLTHPHQTPFGAMRASVDGLAREIGWEPKGFREAFGEALAKGMVKADPEACLIVLPNYLKHNKPESPNVLKGWFKTLGYLPECQLLFDLLQDVKAFAEGWGPSFAEALPQPYPQPSPNQEQEQEQEQEQYIDCRFPENDREQVLPRKQEKIPFKEIIDQLNLKAGTAFRNNTEATRRMIRSLWKQGFNLDDFFTVINHKSEQWVADPKFSTYLRPQTLFSTKFESYLQAARKSGNGNGKQPSEPAQPFIKFTEWGDTSIL